MAGSALPPSLGWKAGSGQVLHLSALFRITSYNVCYTKLLRFNNTVFLVCLILSNYIYITVVLIPVFNQESAALKFTAIYPLNMPEGNIEQTCFTTFSIV